MVLKWYFLITLTIFNYICMIPKLNLGVGEIGFMFCDLHLSLYPSSGDINLINLPCLTLVLPGNTSDSRNSSC